MQKIVMMDTKVECYFWLGWRQHETNGLRCEKILEI